MNTSNFIHLHINTEKASTIIDFLTIFMATLDCIFRVTREKYLFCKKYCQALHNYLLYVSGYKYETGEIKPCLNS
jgi:hypothetical protein